VFFALILFLTRREKTVEEDALVDDLILADRLVLAVKELRESGIDFLDAIERVSKRRKILRERFPERFVQPDQLETARKALAKIQEPVVMLVTCSRADTFSGWFILEAIVEKPSRYHPKYTAYDLCSISTYHKSGDRLAETQRVGGILAAELGCEFVLVDEEPEPTDESHWWLKNM